MRLGLENVEHMRRATDKKRVSPVLRELEALVGLLTNFMAGEVEVKGRCADLGVADLLHKLWVWFCLRREGVVDVLWLLCTFTVDCVAGEFRRCKMFLFNLKSFSLSVAGFDESDSRVRSEEVTFNRNVTPRNNFSNQQRNGANQSDTRTNCPSAQLGNIAKCLYGYGMQSKFSESDFET